VELEEKELSRLEPTELPPAARLPEVHLLEVGAAGEQLVPVEVGDADVGLHGRPTIAKSPLSVRRALRGECLCRSTACLRDNQVLRIGSKVLIASLAIQLC
jgi:hypothetical protein